MKKRKDGRYCTTVRIGGKQKYFYGATPKEAIKRKKQYFDNVAYNEQIAKIRNYNPFDHLAVSWLERQQGNVKRNTYETYFYKVQQISGYFSGQYVQQIDFFAVQKMLDSLYNQGLSKSTIKKHKQILNSILKEAQCLGLIEKNPCDLATIPKNAPTGDRRDLTAEEIQTLLAAPNSEFWHFAMFLYYTGTRLSEAIPVRWSDIDLTKNEICIQRVVSYSRGQTYVDNFLKNKDKNRVIPISAPLRKVLQAIPHTSDLVFTNTKNQMMARNTVRNRWTQFQQESGLVAITPHMLRHTFATNMYKAGVDVKTIQKITGHRDISVLFQRYIHDDMEIVRQSVSLMDKFYGAVGQFECQIPSK